MRLYIKVGTITNAQRGQKILKSNGYNSSIKRIENFDDNGCGYALIVNTDDNKPVELLKRQGIKVRGVDMR